MFSKTESPPVRNFVGNTLAAIDGERSLRFVVWLTCVLFLTTSAIADPDLWGHTLYGLRAMELGVLVERADPFSYTASDAAWVNHEWLTEYQYGVLWSTWGNFGLTLWRNILVCVLFGVAAMAARRAHASLAAVTLVWILSAECLGNFCVFVRPQVATFAFFGIFLLVLRTWWDKPTSRTVWLLPPLMAVWVNLHGGFLAGCGMVMLFCGGTVVRELAAARRARTYDRQIHRRVAGAAMGMMVLVAAATLCNPYGIGLHAMLWEHLGTEQLVREWQPLWSVRQSPVYYAPFVLVLVASAGWRRWKAIDAVVIGVTMWQAAAHVRHVALLTIAVLILLPGPISDAIRRLFPRLSRIWGTPERRWLRAALVLGAVMFPMALQVKSVVRFWQEGVSPWQIAVEGKSGIPGVPLRAVGRLRAERFSGNLITDYGWGQFMLWHLFPESRVAFDGRYRTVYPASLEAEFLQFQTVDLESTPRTPMIDAYPTDLAILPTGSASEEYLTQRSDWKTVYGDDQAVLLARESYLERIGWTPDGERLNIRANQWSVFPGDIWNGTAIAEDGQRPPPRATVAHGLVK